MYRKLICLLFFCVALFAQKIEINAKMFEGSKDNKVGIFSGDVVVKQGKDFLHSATLKINFNNENKITNYTASNVSSFSITMNGKDFKGKANLITYDVFKNAYELSGNVKILEDNKELLADHIILDQKTGVYKIKSTKEKSPVKVIFELEK